MCSELSVGMIEWCVWVGACVGAAVPKLNQIAERYSKNRTHRDVNRKVLGR
jgi:hypothetical protein